MKKLLLLITLTLLLSSCFWKKEEANTEISKEKVIEQIEQKAKDEWIDLEEIKKAQEEMGADMKDISQKVLSWDMTDEQAEKAMMKSLNNSSSLTNMIEKQKKQIPQTLEIIKANLKCIKKADSKSDWEDCIVKSNKLAKKYWLTDMIETTEKFEVDFVWNKESKEKIITDTQEWIQQLEKILPCIQKAKIMTDFIECSEKMDQ